MNREDRLAALGALHLKHKQLEREIAASNASPAQKSNMQHSLSKLMLFAREAIGPIEAPAAGEVKS